MTEPSSGGLKSEEKDSVVKAHMGRRSFARHGKDRTRHKEKEKAQTQSLESALRRRARNFLCFPTGDRKGGCTWHGFPGGQCAHTLG